VITNIEYYTSCGIHKDLCEEFYGIKTCTPWRREIDYRLADGIQRDWHWWGKDDGDDDGDDDMVMIMTDDDDDDDGNNVNLSGFDKNDDIDNHYNHMMVSNVYYFSKTH